MLDIPDECPDTDFLIALVEFADGQEEVLDLVVLDHGHDGVVEFGPGVGAAVGITDLMATALHILPEGEAADAEGVEHVFHALVVGLVVYY